MQEDLLSQEATIRKIMIGTDLKSAMTYQVGIYMNNKSVLVKAITISPSDAFFFNIKMYNVWVEHNNQIKLWKSFIGVPLSIEYEL
jgi:hypothetical protein